jgi:hypothetical protein
MFQQRISHLARFISSKTFFTCLMSCIVALFFSRAALAQSVNFADKMQGFELGDFESQSSLEGGVAPQGGQLYTGPASATPGLDSNNDPYGVWGDFGDVQSQYYTGNSNLLYYQLSSAGATHGSSAVQFYNNFGGTTQDGTTSSFNGALMLINSGADTQEVTALLHASALKFDVTFDRSLIQNPLTPGPPDMNGNPTGPNPFIAFQAGINTPAAGSSPFPQYHISYDSLSVQPANAPANHLQTISSQINYEAGEYHYTDTTTINPNTGTVAFPGTAPTATTYSDSPVVTGTGTTTLTLTVDFTTNRRNGVGATGNGDGTATPLWLNAHQAMVTYANTVDPSSMTGQTYAQDGNFYNIIQLYFSLGTMSEGGLEIDNIRFVLPGDFNQDGVVNAQDIPAAEAALVNLPAYEKQYNMSPYDMNLIGDVNGDGQVTNADLQALITGLKNGTLNAVPEPASFLLLGLGGAFFLVGKLRRKLREH